MQPDQTPPMQQSRRRFSIAQQFLYGLRLILILVTGECLVLKHYVLPSCGKEWLLRQRLNMDGRWVLTTAETSPIAVITLYQRHAVHRKLEYWDNYIHPRVLR